jgi:MraZ protein
MFRGATKVTVDEKGRMVMPTRYREQLVERAQGRVVVTVDSRDRCLLIYPLPEWELIETKLMSLPTLNEEARRLQRLMVGHAVDLELDGHGRILLPPELRDFASLERHGMLIGQGSKFELWSESTWAARLEEMLQSGKATTGLPSEFDSLSL